MTETWGQETWGQETWLGISISIGTDAAGQTIWTGTVTGGYGLKFYGYGATTQTKAGGTGPKCK